MADTSEGGTGVKVTALAGDGSNYKHWSFMMNNLLEYRDLWTAVESGGPKDKKALALICMHVSPELQGRLRDCTTSNEAWESLKNLYESRVVVRRLMLRSKLIALSYRQPPHNKEGLAQYISRAQDLKSDLTAAGLQTDESEVAMQVLAGLPTAYHTMVDIILSQSQASGGDITLDSLLPKLLPVEQRLAQQGATGGDAHAYMAFNRNGGSKGPGAFKRTGGGGGNGGNASGNTGAANKDKTCYYCEKVGHIARECRTKAADMAVGRLKPKGGQQRASGQGKSNPASAAVALMARVNGPQADEGEWTADSGSSQHITPYKHLLQGYQELGYPTSVHYGNGTTGTGIGKGDIVFSTQVNGVPHNLVLRDVLHVPDAAANLFSVKRATRQGAVVQFASDTCVVQVDGATVLRAEGQGDDLYTFQAQYPPRTMAMVARQAKTQVELEHRRYGHLGYDNMARLVQDDMVTGLKSSAAAFRAAKATTVCGTCVVAKQARQPFPPSESRATKPLGLLHTDVMGPLSEESMGGSNYVLTILDDYTQYSVVRPIRSKSDVPGQLIQVVKLLENQTGARLASVRSDRGSEFLNKTLGDYFKDRGIIHQTSAPYTPQQNGRAERLNRTLMDRVRAMLDDSQLPNSMWAEAVVTANYLRNRSPATGMTQTPWEAMFGSKPDVSNLRVFGCPAYVHVPKELRKKLDLVADRGALVGYEPNSKAYRVLIGTGATATISVSRDVTFDETRAGAGSGLPGGQAEPPASHVLLDSDADEPGAVGADGSQSYESDWADAGDGGGEPAENVGLAPTAARGENVVGAAGSVPSNHRKRGGSQPHPDPSMPVRVQPKRLATGRQLTYGDGHPRAQANVAQVTSPKLLPNCNADGLFVPETYAQAMATSSREEWSRAMDDEMSSLVSNNTFEMVDLPPGMKLLKGKWVYSYKYDSTGAVARYKARWVAKGFMQREGVDFFEVYAPTIKQATMRLFFANVVEQGLSCYQLDIKTAFLNGELGEEEIYMEPPTGYDLGKPGQVCRLTKALYGLRQAPRAWHERLKQELESYGFQASESDPGLYTLHFKTGTVYLLVYVDDMLLAGHDENELAGVKKLLGKAFDVKDMGEPKQFVGMEIDWDKPAGTLKISQRRMVSDIVQRYGLADGKHKTVPLSPGTRLTKTEGEPLGSGEEPYAELVGSLLYLSTTTRPDITQAVGVLSRYMSAPTATHWAAAKGVVRYLAGTAGLGIVFSNQEASELESYCDADYAGDIDSRRSTTGYVFMVNGGAISWNSRLQPTVAMSTAEAEYMAAASAVKEALWLRHLMADFGKPMGAVKIYCDNQAAISLVKHPIASARSKHIDVQHHFARERVARGEVEFIYISTDKMVADCMTKALAEAKFVAGRQAMGMRG